MRCAFTWYSRSANRRATVVFPVPGLPMKAKLSVGEVAALANPLSRSFLSLSTLSKMPMAWKGGGGGGGHDMAVVLMVMVVVLVAVLIVSFVMVKVLLVSVGLLPVP